jgi:hypothetical protein
MHNWACNGHIKLEPGAGSASIAALEHLADHAATGGAIGGTPDIFHEEMAI